MSDDHDILGKADALLRRHVPPRTESADDVPVLTELISPGAAADEEEFRRDLVTEVVSAVQSRLAEDFERRLTQHLVTEVQATVAATLGDLQQDIANAVGDAVAEALARRHGK
jgi:hypothetical protein